MEILVQILAIVSPILILFTTFIIVRSFQKREGDVVKGLLYRESEARRFELQHKNRELTMPIRLQAYERMSLFCARIELSQLILRLRQAQTTSKDLRILLVMTIEEEFNHNITQQMYMSDELWEVVSLAKLEAINIVKQVSATVPDTSNAQEWVTAFVKYVETAPQQGYIQAQIGIKKEVSLLF